MDDRFNAVVVREDGGTFTRAVEERNIADLPDGDLLVRVHYSALNYKDALSATGNRGVTRQFPHTPGIDAVGEVVSSGSTGYAFGDQVTVTDYGLGMNTAGGWGGLIRVPAEWAVPLPSSLSPKESMALGTAGLTAALSVREVTQSGVTPDQGEVLVTGATGGVGSLAVALLAKAGFKVAAATGKAEAHAFLMDAGASCVIGRDEIDPDPGRPMHAGRWGSGG